MLNTEQPINCSNTTDLQRLEASDARGTSANENENNLNPIIVLASAKAERAQAMQPFVGGAINSIDRGGGTIAAAEACSQRTTAVMQ